MKLDILCTDGSPLGVSSKTIWGDQWRIGCGGAELALLTMCEQWTKYGYEVVLYNDPKEAGASPFEQRTVGAFDPKAERDVLITFRSPNPLSLISTGLKVWFSCDQHTIGDYAKFSVGMDKIVCISDFHAKHFKDTYGIENTIVIDLPVRVDDYDIDRPERVKNRIAFLSVPDRGLESLWRMWDQIKQKVPDASLVITSDYRLWGVGALNEKHRVRWMVKDDINFLGAISREELIQEELKSDYFIYPSTYDELFCISCAEAQYAGMFPITSAMGALATTNMGKKIHVDPKDPRNDITFVKIVVDIMNDRDETEQMRKIIQKVAKSRFSPTKILADWDKKVFT